MESHTKRFLRIFLSSSATFLQYLQSSSSSSFSGHTPPFLPSHFFIQGSYSGSLVFSALEEKEQESVQLESHIKFEGLRCYWSVVGESSWKVVWLLPCIWARHRSCQLCLMSHAHFFASTIKISAENSPRSEETKVPLGTLPPYFLLSVLLPFALLQIDCRPAFPQSTLKNTRSGKSRPKCRIIDDQ